MIANILRYIIQPLLTLACLVGMIYATVFLLGSDQPLASIPCIALAIVMGFFSFLDVKKIVVKLRN